MDPSQREQGTKEMSQAADVVRKFVIGTQSPVLGRAAAGFLALLLGLNSRGGHEGKGQAPN